MAIVMADPGVFTSPHCQYVTFTITLDHFYKVNQIIKAK